MKKRIVAGLMAGAMLLGGAASAELEVKVPTSARASSYQSGDAETVSDEVADDVKEQIQDLLHDEMVLTATLASGDSGPKYDLSGLSYEELVALKDSINLAIWESEEWQEVTVPQGVWVVGEDIPAGKWTIKSDVSAMRTLISWGDVLSEDGTTVDHKKRGDKWVYIYNPDYDRYEGGEVEEYTVDLQAGDYVEVAVDDGPAVFMPYAGKPSLGFK